ncbi:transglutaminase domain-containing protein [Candidatus Microgenomates bacterium]|nr:transglutaminase domain-containing protein [Candidatus Microgenomates bacterium]
MKDSPELGDYTTSVSVPASFGKPSYIKPVSVKGEGLTFPKEDVLKGISIVFGEYQLFDFTLSYHLKNNRLYPVITEIALPPETAYQEILLDRLEPQPLTVYIDKDGNWLAKYRLEGSQKLDIKATGRARLLHTPDSAKAMPLENPQEYLVPQKYWETGNQAITELAKELKTPRAIYDFVAAKLKYDFGRIEKSLPRAGAAQVLDAQDSAICMEFTDLFVALARAAGIPAREVDGFAYTGNERLRPLSLVKDILHAWPEYYDTEKKLWIAVDPTWGNTSGIDYFDIFDFNHFAFVIKGYDSQYPSPAGSYKEPADFDKKDVEVTFALDNLFEEKRSIAITTDLAKQVMAGFPIKGTFTIANFGNKIFNEKSFRLSVNNLFPKAQTASINPIPPFGKTTINVKLQSNSYFDSFAADLTAVIGRQEFKRKVQVLPFYLVYLPWIGGGLGGIAIFSTAFVAWRIRIQRHKGPGSLRGQSQKLKKEGGKLPAKK